MEEARVTINGRGGLFRPEDGLLLRFVTRQEDRIRVVEDSAGD